MLPTGHPFGDLSIRAAAAMLRAGGATALDFAEASLAAAEARADLNCFVTLDADGALTAARRADAELAAGLDRGPLHGIPVAVKDLMAVAGLPTTMGSRHFAGHIARYDADAVAALRRAGAVLVGTTNLHEIAYGPTGDRSASGPVRNPLHTGHVAGGSSSGSAAAVAAGIVPAALGTDTAGSVRIPAALCGVVGIKPPFGAIGTRGVLPLAPSLDVVGVLAATLDDAAIVTRALTATVDTAGEPTGGWPSSAGRADRPVDGLRVGIVDAEVTRRASGRRRGEVAAAAERLAAAGVTVTELAVPELDDCEPTHAAIQSAEAVAVHRDRLSAAPELFHPEILDQLRAAAETAGWEYVRALDARRQLRAAVRRRAVGLDALLLPTVPIPPPRLDQRTLDDDSGWSSVRPALKSLTDPWNVVDLAALSVPTDGDEWPGAVQLVGLAPDAERLVDVAALVRD